MIPQVSLVPAEVAGSTFFEARTLAEWRAKDACHHQLLRDNPHADYERRMRARIKRMANYQSRRN